MLRNVGYVLRKCLQRGIQAGRSRGDRFNRKDYVWMACSKKNDVELYNVPDFTCPHTARIPS